MRFPSKNWIRTILEKFLPQKPSIQLIIVYNVCCIVPDGPPLNVILSSTSSTSINVNWNLPDPSSRNGIITKHQLNYTEVSQPLNWTTVELNASSSYLIEGLKIFTQYYVSVAAGTQIDGFGPFSQPAMYRTLNDSKC